MDEQKPKVQVIPVNPFKRYKKEDDVYNGGVGIYCRVSTTEQLEPGIRPAEVPEGRGHALPVPGCVYRHIFRDIGKKEPGKLTDREVCCVV